MLALHTRLFHVLLRVIPLLLFFGDPIAVHSQTDSDYNKIYHNWFDQVIGIENLGLYSGPVYEEAYRMQDEKQKFFFSTLFLPGTIDYDGQTYFDVSMKYDVFEDEVIIKLDNELLLDKTKIDSFTIADHNFEKMDYMATDSVHRNGFFEKLIENSFFDFVKKHKKEERKRLGEKLVYYEFVDRNEYFLMVQGTFHNISSRADIVKVFPSFEGEIKKRFSKSSRKLGKEEYYSAILNEVYLMISKEGPKKTE